MHAEEGVEAQLHALRRGLGEAQALNAQLTERLQNETARAETAEASSEAERQGLRSQLRVAEEARTEALRALASTEARAEHETRELLRIASADSDVRVALAVREAQDAASSRASEQHAQLERRA